MLGLEKDPWGAVHIATGLLFLAVVLEETTLLNGSIRKDLE